MVGRRRRDLPLNPFARNAAVERERRRNERLIARNEERQEAELRNRQERQEAELRNRQERQDLVHPIHLL